MRLIDADLLIARGKTVLCDLCEDEFGCGDCKTNDYFLEINNAPTIEAEPVKHGHWVWDGNTRDENGIDWGVGAWRCSLCKCKNHNIPENKNEIPLRWAGSKYCPNCNAKMDEVIDDG